MNRRPFTWLTALAFFIFFAVTLAWSLFVILDPIYVLYAHSNTKCVRIDIEGSRVIITRFPRTSKNPQISAVTLYAERPFSLYRDYSSYRQMYDNKEVDTEFGHFWGWAPNRRSYAGFGYSFGTPVGFHVPTFTFVCTFPTWILLPPFALPLILPTRRLIRARLRQRKNLCPRCAYDLRASTANCPECGQPISRRRKPSPQTQMT